MIPNELEQDVLALLLEAEEFPTDFDSTRVKVLRREFTGAGFMTDSAADQVTVGDKNTAFTGGRVGVPSKSDSSCMLREVSSRRWRAHFWRGDCLLDYSRGK